MTSEAEARERIPGTATTKDIAEIIEKLAPVLDQYPMDHKLIATAATLIIILDPNIDLATLKYGTDMLIANASTFVAKAGSADWLDLPKEKVN